MAYVPYMTLVVVQESPIPTPLPPSMPPDPNLMAMQVVELLTIVVMAAAVILVVRFVVMSPIGQAIGERLRPKRSGLTGEQDDRLARIEGEMLALRGDLGELAERLDFAERVLAERRERQLGSGS
jgi:hypothetical protein